MKRTSTAISTFVSLLVAILLLALLFGVLAMAYSYMGNGQRNFYVKRGNEIIASETKGVRLETEVTHMFYCGTVTGQAVAYDVQVFVNVKNIEDFDFSVDDNRKRFTTDFTDYDCISFFGFSKNENCFYLAVPNEITLLQIVQSKYPDKKITGVPDIVLQKEDSFILTVTDGVEKAKTQIYFCGVQHYENDK